MCASCDHILECWQRELAATGPGDIMFGFRAGMRPGTRNRLRGKQLTRDDLRRFAANNLRLFRAAESSRPETRDPIRRRQ